MSETFTQIIFPPKPKPPEEPRVSFDGQDYWMQYQVDRINFMCKCPKCGLEYCYNELNLSTDIDELLKTIIQLRSFYNQEFEYFCPDRPMHATQRYYHKMNSKHSVGWEEYDEDVWANCLLR